MTPYDLVLRGGRVIDPESMLDGTRDVAIDGGRVSAVSEEHVDGKAVIDVSGLVVAPGFIDLHSHAQTLAGRRLQAFDGVTTALELEAGRAPIHEAYAWDAAMGSPINYGFSTSWAAVRRRVATGVVGDGWIDSCLSVLGETAWRGPLTAEERARLVGHLSDDLAQGAVGIGVLLGYAPDVSPEEYLAVAGLAASAGVPTFTHCRDLVELSTRSKVGGAEELVRAAATTGAHMHVCHVNSTWPREIDRVLDLFERCRAEGGRVTTEAYPYGASATAIGAPFLSPEALAHRELAPSSITYLPSGERVADEARLRQLRAQDPNGLVVVNFLDEDDPAKMAELRRSLNFADAIVASDALPLVVVADHFDPLAWPLARGAVTHPRSAGCFSRALRLWREEGAPLAEAVRRCTLLPARVLEGSCPAMRTRGRVQPGSSADVVVFDAERITDQATYADSTRPSSGVRYLLVDGEPVIRDGELVAGARPGRPITAST
jgi:cytosine/adenosine deaminase-related metal-dependent hydrolase